LSSASPGRGSRARPCRACHCHRHQLTEDLLGSQDHRLRSSLLRSLGEDGLAVGPHGLAVQHALGHHLWHVVDDVGRKHGGPRLANNHLQELIGLDGATAVAVVLSKQLVDLLLHLVVGQQRRTETLAQLLHQYLELGTFQGAATVTINLLEHTLGSANHSLAGRFEGSLAKWVIR